MTIQWTPSSPALADLVCGYKLRDTRGHPGGSAACGLTRYPALPFCCMNFVLEGQLAIAPTVPSKLPAGRMPMLPSTYLMGPNTQPVTSAETGPVHVLSVIFHTAAFARLSGLSMECLVDRVLPLGAFQDSGWANLDRVLRQETDCRLDYIEHFLLQRWNAAGQDFDPAFHRAGLLLGEIPVAVAADRLGWSTRTLERRIRHGFGLEPRQLRQMMRATAVFRGAREAKWEGRREGSLATLASEYGYSDQAHMSRELLAWSGLSPSRLLASVATDPSYWVYRLL